MLGNSTFQDIEEIGRPIPARNEPQEGSLPKAQGFSQWRFTTQHLSLRLLRKSRAMESAPSGLSKSTAIGSNLRRSTYPKNELLRASYSCGNPRTPTLGVGGFLLWKPKNNRQMINSSLEWRTRNGIGCLFLINCKIQDEQIQIRDTEFW